MSDQARRFEWDERKAARNAAKHGIDFLRASRIFKGPIYTQYSPRGDEDRWMTVGLLDGRFVTVVWTRRGEVIRIVSARLDVPASKEDLRLEVDAGVLDWFKGQGDDYCARINAVLRAYVEHQRERSTST